MLRGIADAREVAGLLARTVAATAPGESAAVRTRGRSRADSAPSRHGGNAVALS